MTLTIPFAVAFLSFVFFSFLFCRQTDKLKWTVSRSSSDWHWATQALETNIRKVVVAENGFVIVNVRYVCAPASLAQHTLSLPLSLALCLVCVYESRVYIELLYDRALCMVDCCCFFLCCRVVVFLLSIAVFLLLLLLLLLNRFISFTFVVILLSVRVVTAFCYCRSIHCKNRLPSCRHHR